MRGGISSSSELRLDELEDRKKIKREKLGFFCGSFDATNVLTSSVNESRVCERKIEYAHRVSLHRDATRLGVIASHNPSDAIRSESVGPIVPVDTLGAKHT